jgi:hypothetical protein
MEAIQMPSRTFLLSPANCRGRRAQQVLSPNATFSVAARLRGEAGVPIGELFAHMSGLYFRGKLTYARRFGDAWVITPDRGLVRADVAITLDELVRFGAAEIRIDNQSYRQPLEETARALANADASTEFVLLGSVASEKYVEVLSSIFGTRLLFPSSFVGRGDMSRGGLMLRAAAAGTELEYVPVVGAVRHGSRPPKLPVLQPS